MLTLIILLAIAASIAIAYRMKLNTGLIAIAFAYLIGCLIMDLSSKEVLAGWPLNTMFVILAVSLFYNFSIYNGTLELMAQHLLYRMRRLPALLPLAIYLASALIAALGAGFFTVMAAMAPLALLMARKAKQNELVSAMAVNCGALSGANFMTSGSGIIFRSLMEEASYDRLAFAYAGQIFVASVIFSLLLIGVLMFLTRRQSHYTQALAIDSPPAFTKTQQKNISLILLMIGIVLALPFLAALWPQSEVITQLNTKVDVGFIAMVFAVIALLMNLAPQEAVIRQIPWSTILMISGMGMLIHVAIEAGTILQFSHWISAAIPPYLLPLVLALVAAAMSFFSSTLGVVAPTLFPLVPSLAAATSLNPGLLFACIVIGAQSSAISPFSSGGSLLLGSTSSQVEREELFPALLFKAVPISMAGAAIFCWLMSVVLN